MLSVVKKAISASLDIGRRRRPELLTERERDEWIFHKFITAFTDDTEVVPPNS